MLESTLTRTGSYCLVDVVSGPGYDHIVVEGDVPRDQYTTITDSFHWRAYLIP